MIHGEKAIKGRKSERFFEGNKCHITHVNTLCILYGGVICKVAMYIQHSRIKLVFSNFVHKFWLISVFVTNAKGGDCWH